MIDLKNRVIFVHIPETAGTSVETYFLKARHLRPENAGALGIILVNNKLSNRERANQHYTLQMYESLYFGGLIPDEFKIFTIVRDPYTRFWSEWSSRRLPTPNRFPMSFFLSLRLMIYLAERPISRLQDLNAHISPQYQYLEGLSAHRIRILRYENLATDFRRMVKDWKLPEVDFAFENLPKRKRVPSARDRTRGAAFVERFYIEDFKRLGYSTKSVSSVGVKMDSPFM
jgi:hypothetical protein